MGTVIYPVRDLGRAKAVYGALLGSAPAMESRTTWGSPWPRTTWGRTRTVIGRA
jgi:hypothetical protein